MTMILTTTKTTTMATAATCGFHGVITAKTSQPSSYDVFIVLRKVTTLYASTPRGSCPQGLFLYITRCDRFSPTYYDSLIYLEGKSKQETEQSMLERCTATTGHYCKY